jgi:4-hydroxyphenylpyruvate dioxygenase
MTISTEARRDARTDPFPIKGFAYVEWWVGNAYQCAQFFRSLLGFRLIGYRGPETGVRDAASYLLASGDIRLIVTGALAPDHAISRHVLEHGPGVRDVAFAVPDAERAYALALERGAPPEHEPCATEHERGRVVKAAIHAYGDTIHSLVQCAGDLPDFDPVEDTVARPAGLQRIDHVVANVELGRMDEWVDFYSRIFGFSLLRHFNDRDIHTEYSALMSKVVWDGSGVVKLPINEPATGRRRSQIEEYLEFYRGPGVQHIAMSTPDILATVEDLRGRGLEMLKVPPSYYEDLRRRMPELEVDWKRLEGLGVLADKDEDGYLLQLFSHMLQDRPTVFFEFI